MYGAPPSSIGMIPTVNLFVTLRMYDVGSSIADTIGADTQPPSHRAQGRWERKNDIHGTDRAARGARRENTSYVSSLIIQ